MSMNTAFALLYLAMAVIILIEVRHARRFDRRMDRNATSLMHDLNCAQCGCKNANHDYRK